jgi:hypothetical protein
MLHELRNLVALPAKVASSASKEWEGAKHMFKNGICTDFQKTSKKKTKKEISSDLAERKPDATASYHVIDAPRAHEKILITDKDGKSNLVYILETIQRIAKMSQREIAEGNIFESLSYCYSFLIILYFSLWN